mgnify:CR=1 FL=1
MGDPPIKELEYLHGMTVVDIGDIRVARGQSRRPHSICGHHKLLFDHGERRIWCSDCQTDVEPFDAFELLADRAYAHVKRLKEWEERLSQIDGFKARMLATKALDKAWSSKNMVPACPHCKNGLFPEDFKDGVGIMLGRDYAKARADKARP